MKTADLNRIVDQLEEVDAGIQQIKRQGMCFQYEEKCIVAKFYGLTFEQVDLPYEEWSRLSMRYARDFAESQKATQE